jgi:hypothetical protein
MTFKPATLTLITVFLLAGCAGTRELTASNCTAANGYRLGTQNRAYLGGCPKEAEGAFLAALQRGRALWPKPPQALPYFSQMSELEKQLVAVSESEREPIRVRLRDVEFWAINLVNHPGGNMN